MEKNFKKYLEEQKHHIEEATKLITDSTLNVDDRVINLVLTEKYDLQKQLEQLENKKDSVGKDKYNSLKATFEELREDRTNTNKQLESIKKDNIKLVEELEQTKEKLFDMMPSKSSQRIKEYKARITDLEKLNIILQEEVSSLEKVKTQMLDSVDMVSKIDYDGLISQMKKETFRAEQYERMYQEEKQRSVKLKEHFKSEKQSEHVNSSTVEELEQLKHKLSRKGTKWNREEGKGEQDVIAMKAEGKTFKEITALTGISSATIAKILKNSKG